MSDGLSYDENEVLKEMNLEEVPGLTSTPSQSSLLSFSVASSASPEPSPARTKMALAGFDYRFPIFKGDWRRSKPAEQSTIAVDTLDEPHIKRRMTIIDFHPHIESLYGHEVLTLWVTMAAVSLQVSLALSFSFGALQGSSWLVYILVSFLIGGSITQLMGVVMHEACHNLILNHAVLDRLVALLANVPLPVPIAMSFRRYHLDHHAYQGVLGKDPDLPLEIELQLVKGHFLTKLIWLLIYPLMYVVRGAALQKKPSHWEYVNLVSSLLCNLILFALGGWSTIAYLALSTWFGYSIHPAAAHFIQEHYTWTDGQETYSYYGRLNKLFLNIGFHNEHHDFTKIPWSRLPAVKRAAPEFYTSLYAHASWLRVFWEFLTMDSFGPQSRIERDFNAHKIGRKMVADHVAVTPAAASLRLSPSLSPIVH